MSQKNNIFRNSLYPSIFKKTLDEESFVYSLPKDEVLRILETDEILGLKQSQVNKLLEEHGNNELNVKNKFRGISIYISQFKDFLTLLLLIAAIAGFLTNQLVVGIVLILLIFFNSTVGFIQEFSANRMADSLAKLVSKTTTVIRDGKVQNINSIFIVPGDIILLKPGDDVPADSRVIESSNLECLESSITGEDRPVLKTNTPHPKLKLSILEISNLIFLGTTVISGTGKAVAVGTGINTEFGKIALTTSKEKKDKSPLQKEIFRTGEYLIMIALVVAIFAFVINYFYSKLSLQSTLILSLGLAVGVVPEGLPSTVTAALAIALKKLSRIKVIVKRLTSSETLGACNVIVTDKTGTLTKNEMTVTKFFYLNSLNTEFYVSGTGYSDEGKINPAEYNKEVIDKIINISLLCNNSYLNSKGDNKYELVGDPLEGALISYVMKINKNSDDIRNSFKRIIEIPFDPQRKMMSVLVSKSGREYVYSKGAIESLVKSAKYILMDGKKILLNIHLKNLLIEKAKSFEDETLRVIALGYKELKGNESISKKEIEKDLTIVALLGLFDAPRDDVKYAINSSREAGIKVFMCTGDSPEIALKIGEIVNLSTDKTTVLLGKEVDKMSDQELKKILLEDCAIFARVTPLNKFRIVKLLKELGYVVAVTGDGVNDAPALKAADIGVAMGITGTDVAKEAADMILLNDSFTSIIEAIKEGRIIYDNIKKFIRFTVAIDIAEMLSVFLGSILHFAPIMFVLQILTIDLIVNIIPALILASDIPDPDIMQRKPRNAKTHLFDKETVIPIMINGSIIALIAVFMFYITNNIYHNYDMATTAAYSTLVFSQIANLISSRSYKFSFTSFSIRSYSKILLGIVFIIFIQTFFIYNGFMNSILNTRGLPINIMFLYFAIIIILLVVEESRKFFIRKITFKNNINI